MSWLSLLLGTILVPVISLLVDCHRLLPGFPIPPWLLLPSVCHTAVIIVLQNPIRSSNHLPAPSSLCLIWSLPLFLAHLPLPLWLSSNHAGLLSIPQTCDTRPHPRPLHWSLPLLSGVLFSLMFAWPSSCHCNFSSNAISARGLLFWRASCPASLFLLHIPMKIFLIAWISFQMISFICMFSCLWPDSFIRIPTSRERTLGCFFPWLITSALRSVWCIKHSNRIFELKLLKSHSVKKSFFSSFLSP